MKLTRYGKGILLSGEKIDPEIVFDCGQCFRFVPDENGFVGVVFGRILHVTNLDEGLYLYPVPEGDEKLWAEYFDADIDYSVLEESYRDDPVLEESLKYASGMRLLNQDPFETIITFIISANNNTKRIRRLVEEISKKCGKELCENGKIYYAFPTPQELAEITAAELRALGAGYRAEYIAETAKMIADGYDLNKFYEMDYSTAKKQLCELKGIGPKVADCILLFAYKKKNAFPLDVWMKRALSELYGYTPKNYRDAEEFAKKRFGKYAGIAQQYLFHYMRSK